jgi:O-succinylbenzoic acid--CoA ligase
MADTMDSGYGSNTPNDLRRLTERQQTLGDLPAVGVGKRRWSYAELGGLIEQRAAALVRDGISAGELALCPTAPVLDSLLTQWALARLGAAMLPIRADLPASRREALIQATGAEWCWTPADIGSGPDSGRDPQAPLREGTITDAVLDVDAHADSTIGSAGALIRTRTGQAETPAPAERSTAALDAASTPALLAETSGSSAEPKIVMLSATQVMASCEAVNARLDLRRGDRWLCVLPRHHVGGLAISYRCALAGAELRVQSRFSAVSVQAVLRDGGITHISLVPGQLQRLLSLDPTPPASLRVALLGGQGLDSGLAQRAVAYGWPLYLGYGMSETFSQVAGGWIGADGLPGQGLIPLDRVELSCPRCDESPQRPQPLRVRAPMLMLGYANPRRTAGDGIDEGWLQTSDLACRLPGGGLQVLGRSDDVVLIAGSNVLPAEIERELARLDLITEVAVVGVPDPTWGHRLVALYTGNLEPTQLEAWCRSNLPSHRRPRAFARLETLPTLSSGKRDKRGLAARAAAIAAQPPQR